MSSGKRTNYMDVQNCLCEFTLNNYAGNGYVVGNLFNYPSR